MQIINISATEPFKGDTIKGANSKIYALVNKKEEIKEDSTQYTAIAIPINKEEDAKQAIKEYRLKNIVVEVDGIRFYADPESRADLSDAILEAQEAGLQDTYEQEWKTKDGIKNVTLAQIKTARRKGLEEKGNIVGVINVPSS